MYHFIRWLMVGMCCSGLFACGEGATKLKERALYGKEYPIAAALKNWNMLEKTYAYEGYYGGESIRINLFYQPLDVDVMALSDILIDADELDEELTGQRLVLDAFGGNESVSHVSFRYYDASKTRLMMGFNSCEEDWVCESYGFVEDWHEPPVLARVGEAMPYYTVKHYADIARTNLVSIKTHRWELRNHPNDNKSDKALLCFLTVATDSDSENEECTLVDEFGNIEPYSIKADGIILNRVYL